MNTRIVVLALVMASAAAAPASAQWAIDGTIGAVVPTSGSGFNTGLDLMGAIERRVVPVLPVAVRLEVGYDRIGTAFNVGTENITRVALDGIIDPSIPGLPVRPYFLAGIGVYHVSLASYGSTDFGLNIGGGLRYPIGPVQPFVEVRYHVDYASAASIGFVPIQFGVRVPIP